MANYETLKAAIQQVVKTNGNNEITGALLQQSLLAMINSLGGYYQFAGVATPTTNPGTPDQNVFYITSTPGTYVNFGNLTVSDGDVAILKYNGSWTKNETGIAALDYARDIDTKIGVFSNTENVISGSTYNNYIYGKFTSGQDVLIKIVGNVTLSFALQDDSGTTISAVQCGKTYLFTLSRNTSYLRVVLTGTQVTQSGTLTFNVFSGLGKDFEQYKDNSFTFNDAINLLSLQSEHALVLANGTVATNSSYTTSVYRFDMSNLADDEILYINSHHGGSGVSLVYGYDSSNNPVKSYFTTASPNFTAKVLIRKEAGISYLLLTRNPSTSYVFDVKTIKVGTPVQLLFDEKENVANRVSNWSNTPSNEKYPSEKLVKDSIDKIAEQNVINGLLTLYQSNAAIASDGSIVTVNGYTLYKLDMSLISDDSVVSATIGTGGNHLSLAYGYDSSGNPVKSYFFAESAGTYSFTFKKEPGVSYVLLSKGANATLEFSFIENKPGTILQNLIGAGGITEHFITVSPNGTGENSLIGVLKSLMTDTSDSKPSETHRYTIQLSAGTYNIDCSGETLPTTNGLFVMPYTTIKGAGRGVTKLQFLYAGSNDNVMSLYSGLNMPYTCNIFDLTIDVENIRYAIHSDGGPLGANDANIYLRNVELIHRGLNNGLTPTYNIPNAWGGGSYNNCHLRFENCRFYAAQCAPFANHDRTGLTASTYFDFINCEFENDFVNSELNDSITNPSIYFNSWGSGIPIYCNFINCRIHRYIELAVTTSYNANAKSDYQIKTDNDQIIRVQATNGSDLEKHWSTGNCKPFKFSAAISKGTPVVMLNTMEARAMTGTDSVKRFYGILLHNVAAGGIGIVMKSGFVTDQIVGAFATADGIGWDGSAWSVVTSNALVLMLFNKLGKILEQ